MIISETLRKKRSENAKKQWLQHNFGIGMKGKHHTKEANEKNRLAHIGKSSTSLTKFKKGQSKLKNAYIFPKGKDHPNWKGGITRKSTNERNKLKISKEYKLWRKSVFTRDNWTCQNCKTRGGELHPHHIKNWAKYKEFRRYLGK